MELSKVIHINGSDFLEQHTEYIFLDVRPEYELSKLFDIPFVEFIPYSTPDDEFLKLPYNINIVVADAVGLRSKEVCQRLLSLGYTKVYNLVGGIVEWDKKGLPTIKDKYRILNGSCMCQLNNRNH